MSKRTLVLHIGMPKTGTTSIQEALGESAKALRKQGIYFPAKKPYNHSITFLPLFLRNPRYSLAFKKDGITTEAGAQKRANALKKYWRGQFSRFKSGTFIISAEGMTVYRAEQIESLQAFIEGVFDEVKVIVYVRPPVEAIKSYWGQLLKTFSHDESKQDYLARVIKNHRYAFIEEWANAFGKENVIVRPFVKAHFYNGHLLDDFMHAIGAETGMLKGQEVRNTAFGQNALALLYECNRRYPVFVDGKPNAEKGLVDTQRIFFDLLNKSDDTKFDLQLRFNAQQAEHLNQQVAFVNDYLDPSCHFPSVEASEEATTFYEFEDIPKEYFIELINDYNKYIEWLLDMNLHAQAAVYNPQAGKKIRAVTRFIRRHLVRFGM